MSHHHKARRTKQYRPRVIDTNPIELAINQAMRLLLAEQTALTEPMDAAFAQIRAGHGSLEHWARLADSLNIATALAQLNVANDHLATFEAGQQALSCLHERVAAGGCWTLKGPEIAALDDALFVHKVQLSVCSRRELREAVTSVMHRVQQALAGNAASGVRVCLPGLLGGGQPELQGAAHAHA